jgi:hypothetical protein
VGLFSPGDREKNPLDYQFILHLCYPIIDGKNAGIKRKFFLLGLVRVFSPNPSKRWNKEFLTELAGQLRAATRSLKTLTGKD